MAVKSRFGFIVKVTSMSISTYRDITQPHIITCIITICYLYSLQIIPPLFIGTIFEINEDQGQHLAKNPPTTDKECSLALETL